MLMMKKSLFPLMLVILLVLTMPAGVSMAAIPALKEITDSILWQVPNWYTDGIDSGVEYGGSVAGAGDVNDDGYDDIIMNLMVMKGRFMFIMVDWVALPPIRIGARLARVMISNLDLLSAVPGTSTMTDMMISWWVHRTTDRITAAKVPLI